MVSIILPTYNGEAYIAQSIESILSQTYKKFELIIVMIVQPTILWRLFKDTKKKMQELE